jgi:hypothetical protein
MRKKYLLVPALSLLLLGAGTASAHGWFTTNATPQEVATRATQMFEKQAALLGIGVDEYKQAWAEGKSFQEIAESKGITQEQLKQKMQEQKLQQMKDHLNTLVNQGIITQAQADARLNAVQNNLQNSKTGKGFGRHMGFGMGF